MISYNEALQIILKNSAEKNIKKVSLLKSLNQVSASAVFSKINVPSFNNSAMDGFAIRSFYIENASAEYPVKLKIDNIIAAGENSTNYNLTGTVQIMTGALVPEEYDAVIPVEEVEVKDNIAIFKRPAKKNENIRFIGEDVGLNQKILSKEKQISAEDIMLLSATGISEVEVYTKPKVQIFSTGNEITDDYNAPLEGSKIYNSNSPFLISRALEEGLEVNYGGIISDNSENFKVALSNISPKTIIITTGAVSKGKWDFIPETLKEIGAKIHFHRVNIRPGKPILFATLPNGSSFFGLPGNPISAAIGFRFFVLPLIRNLLNLSVESPIIAELKNNFVKKGNFKQFLKSSLELINGKLFVNILDGQESFKISPMTEGNSWVILDETIMEVKVGTILAVVPYKSNQLFSSANQEALCKVA